jgi:hypothetical protein
MIPYRQIENIRLHHQRHPGYSYIESYIPFFQVLHDAACRIKAEGASS